MSLRTEALRISQMLSNLTVNWPMFRMDFGTLDLIESGAVNGDQFLAQALNDLGSSLKSISRPEDYDAIGRAYEIYEEAAIYLLVMSRGFPLIRTPGTGGHGQKRPDFQCNHSLGTFFIEVKTLDFQDGWMRHREIANEALNAKANLDAQARKQGVHFGNPVEISSHRPGTGHADRIETAIKKIKGNAKMGQLIYGPTILVVDLRRLSCDADDPLALLPTYFDAFPTSLACVSGALWHIAFGHPGDLILTRPEFEGKSNLDRRLNEAGVYLDYPELMALVFVVRSLSGAPKIFALRKLTPNFSTLINPTSLAEHEIGEILHHLCDAVNNDRNEGAFEIQERT